jgi:trimeric autotransporter adhesin
MVKNLISLMIIDHTDYSLTLIQSNIISMRKRLFSKLLLAIAFILGGFGTGQAQLTGIKTIPGDYATVALAVADLNTQGVGTGGVTFNVAAGHTETNAALVVTVATNPPNAARTVVFQKNGAGANPLLTAGTGVSTTVDAIIKLDGVDYVTFDGIDLQENVANVTATTQMEWGYALVKTGATNGAQNNTIKNCTVTLNQLNTVSVGLYCGNHIATNTTGITVSSFAGTNSYNKFQNNTVQNCYHGIEFNGYNSPAPYDLFDQNNLVGVDGVSTRRNQVIQFGGAGGSVYGIYGIYQNGLSISNTYINNAGGAATTVTLNGIFLSTGNNASATINADTITLASGATTSQLIGINNSMGNIGAGNSVAITNNVIDACTYATATTGEFRGIAQTVTASNTTISGNRVSNITLPGTGQFSGIYYSGTSALLVLSCNINNNTVSGNTKNGTGGTFNGIYASGSTYTTNAFSNTITNNSNATSSGETYGYYNFAVGYNENVYNNTITNLAGGTGQVNAMRIESGSGPTDKQIYGNTIFNITANTTAAFAGIQTQYGTNVAVYNNNISNLTNNSATGGTPAVSGINFGTSNNVQVNCYNNVISDLKAPNASNVSAIFGIYVQGSISSFFNIHYNTVYLNATSVGANFGTSAIATTVNPLGVDLKNNIFANASVPAGTGFTRAITRAGVALTNYPLTSGFNCVYVPVGANRFLYSDGTNNEATLATFKARVGSREQASFSELPPFVNIATTPYNLHIQGGVPTQCESGGSAVTTTTVDADAQNRYPVAGFPTAGFAQAPDVGYDEFGGNFTDLASPDIQYTVLTNSSVAATRVLTNFATITDPSGVNNTLGTKARLYYKRSTHANTYVDNTSGTDGWKFVEASNAVSPYNFTINYALMFGGGGVVAGDIIQYFVVAQDLDVPTNVGINSGGFATAPLSVALTLANFPLTGIINQYTIVTAAFSGVVPVGPTELITSLTNAGGAFNLINLGVLSGNVTLSVTGDMTAETGTFALNQWAEEGVGNYTVSIVPIAAVQRTISGSSAAAALIRLDGADRFTIDGRFAAAGTFLTFRNTSNLAPTIGLINDAQNNTISFAIIESGNTATAAPLAGAVYIGTTTGLLGNDNNTITGCEIRDRSDVAGTPAVGISCVGTNTLLAGYNNNCTISNNRIHDWFLLNSPTQTAIAIGVGNSGFSITGNSIYQTVTRTHTVSGAIFRGIQINNPSTVPSNGGFTISNNFIGGTAPNAGGGDMTYTVSGVGTSQVLIPIILSTGLIPNSIQGNTITKIDFTTNAPAAAASIFIGIQATQGIWNIGNTTGNVIGGATGNDLIKITVNAGGAVSSFMAGMLLAPVSGYVNVQNNTIGGITFAGTTAAGAIIPQFIQLQGTPSATNTISNNLIGSTTTANSNRNNAVSAPVVAFGIRQTITTAAALVANNNIVQNFTDASINAGSIDFGMLFTSTVGSTSTLTITNNTVKDFVNNAAAATIAFTTYGLAIQNYGGNTHTISGNTISGVANNNSGVGNLGYAVGVQLQGNTLGGTISKNKVFDIRNAATSGTGGVAGFYISSGNDWTISNNMVSVNNNGATNTVFMAGIADFSGGGNFNYYYNSVYVGGSALAGASNSYAYIRGNNSKVTLKNNLLYNERTGGTGFHYAVGNTAATPASNWTTTASNNNFLVSADASRLAEWGAGIGQTLAQLQTSSSGDALSFSSLNSALPAATIFTSTATGNLKVPAAYYLTPSYLESRGVVVAGIITDYENDARPGPVGSVNGGGTAPDIGADEFDGTRVIYDAAADSLFVSPTGCFTSTETVTVTITNTGNVALDFAYSAITVNAAVTGPNPVVFTPVTINSGTLAVGASQNVVMSTTYDMSLAGTYVFSSSITMSRDEVAPNNTMTPDVTIVISGGTVTPSANPICAGAGSTLTEAGYTSGGTIQWEESVDGIVWTPIGGATNPTVLVNPTDSMYYRAVICGVHNSNSLFLIVNPAPLVDLGADSTTCAASLLLDAANAGATYLWSTTDVTQTINPSTSGTYSVIVTDGSSCQGFDTVVVNINLAPVVNLGADTVQCGGSITFDAGNAGATYEWSTTDITQTLNVTSSGNYSVTVSNPGAGCSDVDSVDVTINPIPVVDLGADTTVCGSIDLDAGNAGATYAWSTTDITQSITVTASGTYFVDVDLNGCTDSDTIVVIVNAIPSVTLTLPQDTVCQELGDVTLSGGSPAGGVFSGPGVTGTTFDPSAAGLGTQTITYTFTDANGCTNTNTDTWFVDICTGIDEPTANIDMAIYPNPNSGIFYLEIKGLGGRDVTAEVYSMEGKQVWMTQSQNVPAEYRTEINLSDMSRGVYLVKVQTGESVKMMRVVTE